jgi:hypothetical protein
LQWWPVSPTEPAKTADLELCLAQGTDRSAQRIIAGGVTGAFLTSFGGAPTRKLYEPTHKHAMIAAAFDPEGARAALHFRYTDESIPATVQVVELNSERVISLPVRNSSGNGPGEQYAIRDLGFGHDGRLYSAGHGGIRRWHVATKKTETLRRAESATLAMTPDGRYLLAAVGSRIGGKPATVKGELILFDLQRSTQRQITTHGSEFNHVAIDASGEVIATLDTKNMVRIGKSSGEEPHLLIAERGHLLNVVISPDHRWVAAGTVSEIHLWPMPDLSRPALHTLPRSDLLARLSALTNLRVVSDPAAPSGYRVDFGPFPGWKDTPTW